MKLDVDRAMRKAETLARQGRRADAERAYDEILRRFPANSRALAGLRALSPGAALPASDLDALIALRAKGRFGEVAEQAVRLAKRYPNAAVLHSLAGSANERLKRFDEALANYDAALRLQPAAADGHFGRGTVLRALGRTDEALASFEEAIRLRPEVAAAHYHRANILMERSQFDEALAGYDRVVALKPDFADAHNNRGNVLHYLKRHQAAIASYDMALQFAPALPGAHGNRGVSLAALGRLDEALASYDRAIALAPGYADAHNHRGNVLQDLKRLDEALASYRTALLLRPDFSAAAGQVLHLGATLCDWRESAPPIDVSRLGLGGNVVSPFGMLVADDDPARQLERARNWSKARAPAALAALPRPKVRPRKLRIGYFSADFKDHAVMVLMAKLFEVHDRDRFELHAFGYAGRKQDAMRKRLIAGVDHFHDVEGAGDREVAELARGRGIDIAVDLTGYTRGGRPGIFACRPAPVQMNYLGFAGTMGCDFIDYIVVDEVVVPRGDERFYAEKIIRLPHCYLVTDDARPIAERQWRRTDLGLPDDGFVFCCFNGSNKISPMEFDIWMRLLGKVPGSVLWLLEGNPWVRPNLRAEAAARGVDPGRLVFAPKISPAEHLARHRGADLFLDTFNYNAHTTGADALWAGLPMVTKPGSSFPSRVGASLLHAIGMHELVTETAAAYEQLALDLATDPDRLAQVRAKLEANRPTAPLFDTLRFARNIERAYELAYERCLAGLPADHLDIHEDQD